MLFFNRRKPEPPKPVDRVGAFCTIVSEAIDNATGANADWATKVRVADALGNFERALPMEIAIRRPLR